RYTRPCHLASLHTLLPALAALPLLPCWRARLLFLLLSRPPPGSTLFPYMTLFRSSRMGAGAPHRCSAYRRRTRGWGAGGGGRSMLTTGAACWSPPPQYAPCASGSSAWSDGEEARRRRQTSTGRSPRQRSYRQL